MAMERESSSERSRAQLEVDWQRRCEDTEREVYMKQEQLVVGLTKQRDQVCARTEFVHLEKFSSNFSSSSFVIRVNLLHSFFLFDLL